MGVAQAKQKRKFTYGDYLTWDDNERWELIHGEAYNMTPAPVTAHQSISVELLFQLKGQLEGSPCRLFHAPFDVRLPLKGEKEKDIENVVQPDISLVCDQKKLDEKGCLGAPDLVIEILSPATSRKDRMEKFYLYEQAGVKEYWLLSPDDRIVETFILKKDGKYGRPRIYCETDTIQLSVLKDAKIDLNPVFSTG